MVVIGNAIKCMEQGQNGFPIWSLYMISISHLMLSLNSSTNIFIYFFLSSRFRQDCKRRYSRMKNTIRHDWKFKFYLSTFMHMHILLFSCGFCQYVTILYMIHCGWITFHKHRGWFWFSNWEIFSLIFMAVLFENSSICSIRNV